MNTVTARNEEVFTDLLHNTTNDFTFSTETDQSFTEKEVEKIIESLAPTSYNQINPKNPGSTKVTGLIMLILKSNKSAVMVQKRLSPRHHQYPILIPGNLFR